MLIEMHSPAFKENGKERPPIKFHEGLNVVLGTTDGTNSIGKSSALMAIDFVFGGNSYLSRDVIKNVGDHTIFFTFEFNGEEFRFARNTADPDNIQPCDDKFKPMGKPWEKVKYCDWLKEKYGMNYPGLAFRPTLSSFFRIAGKENTLANKPLNGLPGDGQQKIIDRLVKLFNRYGEIEDYSSRLEEQKKKLSAYKEARKYRFVSDLVGGKTQYDANLAEIHSLQVELDTLTSQQVETHTEEDIEKKKRKSDLKDERFRLEEKIEACKRRVKLLDMSLAYGLYPTEADLSSLQEFFPQVNLRKLYEVEGYHKKLAQILDDQFSAEREVMQNEIDSLQQQIDGINDQIKELGFTGNLSKEFLDRHSEIKGKMDALKAQNEAYITLTDLQDAKKKADDTLKKAIDTILMDIEQALNAKMKEYYDTLYVVHHKPPYIHFNEYNSFRFETQDDIGTAANFKGMIIFDLAILNLTSLPALVHDSLILKDISDGSIEGILKLYAASTKQIFISFDKQAAYTKEAEKILEDNRVLQLSDNHCELYGFSWNVEENTQDEGQL